MSNQNRRGVGVIGLGIGEAHLEAYIRDPRVEVRAVCDLSEAKLAACRARFPEIKHFTSDAETILSDPEIHVVSIASYEQYHYDQTVAALRGDKHVFVEKPMCQTREQARTIRTILGERPELKLSSNLILRRYEKFRQLREMCRTGALGQVYLFEADYNYGRLEKIVQGWRAEEPWYSIVQGGGVHVIDLMCWATGLLPNEVFAVATKQATQGTAFRFQDCVVALLRFDNGTIGKMAANFGCVYPHNHRVSVYGTNATFENLPSGAQLYSTRDETKSPTPVAHGAKTVHKGELIKSFLDSVCGSGKAEVEESDVFNSLSICFAVEESMTLGKPVSIEYL